MLRALSSVVLCLLILPALLGQSIAREWNEILLQGIRTDRARPTVHARNLFHLSAGTYDIWSAITSKGRPYFLGREVNGVDFTFDPALLPEFPDEEAALERAISIFYSTLLFHRFADSPRRTPFYNLIEDQLAAYTLNDLTFAPDYTNPDPGGLGAYLADRIIRYGLNDGANEADDYNNQFYEPVNNSQDVEGFGIGGLTDPDRWQPLAFEVFVDQSGQVLSGNVPEFLGAEWGQVTPFALSADDLTIYNKPDDNADWYVYHDPGPPPSFYDYLEQGDESFYRWNFELVAKWSNHLTPDDGVIWDISPASLGNIGVENYPETDDEYRTFYDEFEGGDPSRGHALNPVTGAPYPPNLVPRGDYTRVLAEFWADGPDSETPPGHWFTILNTIMEHPLFTRDFKGEGDELPELEYEVKVYFALAGAMHDAAVTAWGIKGYYDYIRPFSALRFLAVNGQRSDPNSFLAPYSEAGIGLSPGYVEEIESDTGVYQGITVGGIKFNSWRGNRYLRFSSQDSLAGVGWINALSWEPYQRPTFVTPNFAGYLSGHSTFSSAAAQVLELMTGDPFFPGGVGEFVAPANEFLVFESGPSVDVVLQWATYRDASDQTSLSRIWGGIHPPIDDIPGRKIGIEIGNDAFSLAESLFNGTVICPVDDLDEDAPPTVSPNALRSGTPLRVKFNCMQTGTKTVEVYNQLGQLMASKSINGEVGSVNTGGWRTGSYYLRVKGAPKGKVTTIVIY